MQSPLVSPAVAAVARIPAEEEARLLLDDMPTWTDSSLIEQAFENSHDCIALVDMQGIVVYMNLPGSCLMGLEERPPGRQLCWADLWSSDDHDVAEYSLDEARSGHQCRFLACRPMTNGLPRWWDVAASPVFDWRGVTSRMFCVCRDVTSLKEAEMALRREIFARETPLARCR